MSDVIMQHGLRFERLPGMSDSVVTVRVDDQRKWFDISNGEMDPLDEDQIAEEMEAVMETLWEEVQRLRNNLGVVVDD